MAELVAADQVRDHWWWRPGWRPGRRFYTWHLTFEDQPALHALTGAYQRVLAGLPGLDPVPARWLHLTTQGVGFTDEVAPRDVDAIAAAARTRLAEVPAPVVTFDSPLVLAESVVLAPRPREPVDAVRAAIRAGIAEVWGADRVPEAADAFRPHVSLAYVNTGGPAAPLAAALQRAEPQPVTLTIPEASLIILGRDEHLYQWETYAAAALAGAKGIS